MGGLLRREGPGWGKYDRYAILCCLILLTGFIYVAASQDDFNQLCFVNCAGNVSGGNHTAGDIGSGTYPKGNFIYQDNVTINNAKIGRVNGTDTAYFAHKDRFNIADFAIRQTQGGETTVNSRSTRDLILGVGNALVGIFGTDRNFNVTNNLKVGGNLTSNADKDGIAILGRAKICSIETDTAYFAHYDRCSTANYALKQSQDGTTQLSSRTSKDLLIGSGNSIDIEINGTIKINKSTRFNTNVNITENLYVGGNVTINGTLFGGSPVKFGDPIKIEDGLLINATAIVAVNGNNLAMPQKVSIKELEIESQGMRSRGRGKYKDSDVEVEDAERGLILTSFNGSKWLVWSDDSGTLFTTKIASSPEISFKERQTKMAQEAADMEQIREQLTTLRGQYDGAVTVEAKASALDQRLTLIEDMLAKAIS